MSKQAPKPSHQWFKLFSREWLRGTIRFDLDSAERGVWADLLAMANESRVPGLIQANEGQAYPHEWLAHSLNIPPVLFEQTLAKCKESGRIFEDSTGIQILNWWKYQESNKAKSDTPTPNSNVSAISMMLEKQRGYASPCYAAEARAVLWMLKHEYSPDDIMSCYLSMLKDKFWQDKELFMMSVQKTIGKWKKGPQEPPGLAGLPDVTA